MADREDRPLQIIRSTDDNNFEFLEENLATVLDKVPHDKRVAVVSVVGGFRTGKSFLLSFFLRYLEHAAAHPGDESEAWMSARGQALAEGNSNAGVEATEAAERGFKWRGGSERQTTGIWMWSAPFFRKSAIEGGRDIAVLLVDTQGMFDNETTMALTSCIFGISTMISSHQIYNVEKRIAEDNLQHLAMFAEYGRVGVSRDEAGPRAEEKVPLGANNDTGVPFQRLEFLIRDYQDFEDEDDVARCEEEINQYWAKVKDVESREAEDLRSTREQITACFESTTVFALTHPGAKVTKKTYDGHIEDMEAGFRRLLNRYVRRVFDPENLDPKTIFDRAINAVELRAHIQTYAKLFEEGVFPEARTMLAATVKATNDSARMSALHKYQIGMDRECGPERTTFVNTQKLEAAHNYHFRAAMEDFDRIATIGSKSAVSGMREETAKGLEREWTRYKAVNTARNPLKNVEAYLIPGVIGGVAIVLRFFSMTCSSFSNTCRNVSDTLSFVTTAVFLFLFVMNLQFFKMLWDYVNVIIGKVAKGEDFMMAVATTKLPKGDEPLEEPPQPPAANDAVPPAPPSKTD